MIRYERVTQRVNIAAGVSALIELVDQVAPFEDVNIWVQASAVGNFDATPTLNEQGITAQKIAAVTTIVPQRISMPGVYPPNAPIKGVASGVIPGVLVKNNGSGPAIYLVTIIARVYGDAV